MWARAAARRRLVSQAVTQATRPVAPSALPGRVWSGAPGDLLALQETQLGRSRRCLLSCSPAQRWLQARQPAPFPAARAFSTSSSGGAGASETGSEARRGSQDEPAASLEERVRRLEVALEAQQVKLAEVEKMARRKGIIALFMDYGAPLALWYAGTYASMLFCIYMLLELEFVSWHESVLPLLEGLGLGPYVERIDPALGNFVIAFAVNELLEPLRLPFVLATGKPVIELGKRLRSRLRAKPA